MDKFCIYILYSEKLDKFYVGSTGNLEDRLLRHNSGRSTFTKNGIPWKLVYTEKFDTRIEAVQRELFIKKQKSRKYIAQLVQSIPIFQSGES
jgi:putative endonuclease